MEPVTLLLAGSLLAKLATGIKRHKAKKKWKLALRQCECARLQAVDAYNKCVDSSAELLADHQGALGAYQGRVDSLLQLPGVQECLFSRDKSAFSELSEKELKALAAKFEKLLLPRPAYLGDHGLTIATLAALTIKGVKAVDRHTPICFPFLHTNLHDLIASIPLHHAGAVADSLGALGAIDCATLLTDLTLVLGAVSAVLSLKGSKELEKQAEALDVQARKFARIGSDAQIIICCATAAAKEIRRDSYNFFLWSLLAEKQAHIARRAMKKTRTVQLPEWLLEGLRRSASSLWATLQHGAVSSESVGEEKNLGKRKPFFLSPSALIERFRRIDDLKKQLKILRFARAELTTTRRQLRKNIAWSRQETSRMLLLILQSEQGELQ